MNLYQLLNLYKSSISRRKLPRTEASQTTPWNVNEIHVVHCNLMFILHQRFTNVPLSFMYLLLLFSPQVPLALALSLQVVDAKAISPSMRGVSNKFAECSPTPSNVDFHALLQTFTSLIKATNTRPKSAVVRLQMFTPMPLESLACTNRPSPLCKDLSRNATQEISDIHFTAIWKNLYPSSGSQQDEPERPCNKMNGKHSANCTTDFSRFPPVLCEATCRSSCDCCRQRTREENGGHHIKKRVHFMQIKSCHEGIATWVLKQKILLPISPNSCVCTS